MLVCTCICCLCVSTKQSAWQNVPHTYKYFSNSCLDLLMLNVCCLSNVNTEVNQILRKQVYLDHHVICNAKVPQGILIKSYGGNQLYLL